MEIASLLLALYYIQGVLAPYYKTYVQIFGFRLKENMSGHKQVFNLIRQGITVPTLHRQTNDNEIKVDRVWRHILYFSLLR